MRAVSELLGRSAHRVHAHATQLGGIRLGTGPEAGIGFDLVTIEQERATTRSARPDDASRPAVVRHGRRRG
jgi:hypothetical protein